MGMGIVKTEKDKDMTSRWILMRTNHFHFLNHSDFDFDFLHHGKDGGDKDASHRVDLNEDKPFSLNHSDFHFYFLHHGKDGADKNASHRVDLNGDKSLPLSKSQ